MACVKHTASDMEVWSWALPPPKKKKKKLNHLAVLIVCMTYKAVCACMCTGHGARLSGGIGKAWEAQHAEARSGTWDLNLTSMQEPPACTRRKAPGCPCPGHHHSCSLHSRAHVSSRQQVFPRPECALHLGLLSWWLGHSFSPQAFNQRESSIKARNCVRQQASADAVKTHPHTRGAKRSLLLLRAAQDHQTNQPETVGQAATPDTAGQKRSHTRQCPRSLRRVFPSAAESGLRRKKTQPFMGITTLVH